MRLPPHTHTYHYFLFGLNDELNMKRKITILFTSTLLFTLFLISVNAYAQQRFDKLIWADEFNTTGMPDANKWNYDTGRGCPQNCGWGNNELQYYTTRKENVLVENGLLKIKANREAFNGASFTSAKLHSKGKFEVKYGRIEVRAKVPAGVGTWPAIWMLGSNIDQAGWPACGEIDIMEHRGRELNKIFGTFHYPGHAGDKANGNTRMVEQATSEFHIYSAEWTEKEIRIFADGVLVHSLANSNSIPFNHDFYLILNVAVGGGFAGPVDPAFAAAEMEIDYVRVYQ